MVKVYLAAPWAHRDLTRKVAARIEAWGFEITEKWWDHEDSKSPEELQRQALLDVKGVLDADIFVVLQAKVSEGKAVEFGLAVANGLEIIMVAYPDVIQPIFAHLPGVVIVSGPEEPLFEALEDAEMRLQDARRPAWKWSR